MPRGKKKAKKALSNADIVVTVANFDTREPTIRPVYENVPLQEARLISGNDYLPTGGTPLNDAVLKFAGLLHENYKRDPDKLHVGLLNDESSSIEYYKLTTKVIEGTNTFLDELKRDNSEGGEPGVIMVIMTDGEENSSREDPTGEQVRNYIQAREADGWNFFYLGANQDSWASGTGLGLGQTSTTYDFQATQEGATNAYAAMATSVNLRKTTRSADHAVVVAAAIPDVKNFVDDEEE